MAYRIEKIEGCITVYGSVPSSVMVAILKDIEKGAVLNHKLQNQLGASLVAGTPENLKKLAAISEKPKITGRLRSELGEGVCNWAEAGNVAFSSNFMLFTFTGFNALAWFKKEDVFKPATCAYPHDPDDMSRCRDLLEAEPRLKARLPELSATSPVWASLVTHWEEICTLMDAEAPNWRQPECTESAPETNVLIHRCARLATKPEPVLMAL